MPVLDSPAVKVPIGDIRLGGDLHVPERARAMVIFAHGSGSSRLSPRNRYVAKVLQDAALGTFLFDLLTSDEDDEDRGHATYRFDLGLLSRRLVAATDWIARRPRTRRLPIGYFGASTGCAAAIRAATERPDLVGAVVSRGGRPDLAGNALDRLQVPTLLIVGGNDERVIPLNMEAAMRIDAPKRVHVVPGATHLFEEPGALDEVAFLARGWFLHHLLESSEGCS
jgi:putative phosphoribosyl transferase